MSSHEQRCKSVLDRGGYELILKYVVGGETPSAGGESSVGWS